MNHFAYSASLALTLASTMAVALVLFPTVARSQDVDNLETSWINEFRAIAFEGDDIWAATDGGIVKWNVADGTGVRYSSADEWSEYGFYCVAIHEGVKWFGGQGWVCRFDGETWKVFSYPIGFYGDYVSAIAVDHDGVVWFGANFGPIRSLDSDTWYHYNWIQERSEVSSIVVDSNNVKWFATGSGVIRYDNHSMRIYTEADGLPYQSPGTEERPHSYCKSWIRSIAVASDDTVYAVSGFGLSQFDGTGWKTLLGGEDSPERQEYFDVSSMVMDSSDILWYMARRRGTRDGTRYVEWYLTQWDGHRSISHSTVGSLGEGTRPRITIDPNGTIWAAGAGGISRFNSQGWETYRWNDLPDSVITLAIEVQESPWIRNYLGGTMRYDGNDWKVYGIGNLRISALAIDAQGDIWIGTDGGLVNFDGVDWTIYSTYKWGYNTVRSLAADGQGNIWIGTYGGLIKFDGVDWTVYDTDNSGIPANLILSLSINAQGDIWIGMVGGAAAKFDGAEGWTVYDTSNSELPNNEVRAVAIDSQGNLWTLAGGLAKFDGENWTIYNRDNSELPDNDISCLAIDAQGEVWIGTSGGGLAKLHGAHWVVYTTGNSRLPSDYIHALAADERGNLWIGTGGNGLAVYREGGVILTDVEGNHDMKLPSVCSLSQNYPNPFNASTGISFSIPKSSHVKVVIYNLVGQLVCELVDGAYAPGSYHVRWNGTDSANAPVSSGIYFYRMTTDAGTMAARKMMVLR